MVAQVVGQFCSALLSGHLVNTLLYLTVGAASVFEFIRYHPAAALILRQATLLVAAQNFIR